jgi:hypothetical protein
LPKLELDEQLKRDGLRCEELGRSSEVNSSLLGRREEHHIRVRITAGKQPLGPAALSYTLYDAGGNELGTAKVLLPGWLPSGGQAEAVLGEAAIGKAHRLVIHR